jgi:ABC-type multidrug transport system ATPase subunit
LWLLDEPHAGLDNDARDLVDVLIRDAAAAGATVLVASHELERSLGLAHRTVVITGGLVVADSGRGRGTPPHDAQVIAPEVHGVP